jgi:transposase
LRTGAPWADLPKRYPSYQTCHRRFQQWVRAGVLPSILQVFAQALHDEGYLDLHEAFIDGSFSRAKRGGACVGKTKRGKGFEDHGHRRSSRASCRRSRRERHAA